MGLSSTIYVIGPSAGSAFRSVE